MGNTLLSLQPCLNKWVWIWTTIQTIKCRKCWSIVCLKIAHWVRRGGVRAKTNATRRETKIYGKRRQKTKNVTLEKKRQKCHITSLGSTFIIWGFMYSLSFFLGRWRNCRPKRRELRWKAGEREGRWKNLANEDELWSNQRPKGFFWVKKQSQLSRETLTGREKRKWPRRRNEKKMNG